MITPPYLNKGDKVAIVAPARKIQPEDMAPAIRIFRSWGLEVVEGENLYASFDQFAGKDSERTADFQRMLDDESIKAIFCARGGYGSVRIIDRLDFSNFARHPKWLVGYSDFTVVHSHINRNYKVETIHSAMPVNFKELDPGAPAVTSLKKALFGADVSYAIPSHPLNREGKAHGRIVGGNLSILYSLAGTHSDIDTDGRILFLEDVDEYLYHLDRMMMNLKRNGKLGHLSGIVVGGMTKMRDNEIPYGKTPYEIIADAVKEFDYPICFGFPAGHQDDNRAMILGREVSLEVSSEVSLHF